MNWFVVRILVIRHLGAHFLGDVDGEVRRGADYALCWRRPIAVGRR